jgi:iron complex transport system substrate-binding protein
MDNDRYNAFGVEQLLAARPEVLMYGRDDVAHPSLAGEATRHRVLRQTFAGRSLSYPESLYNCGVPQSATAAVELRAALAKMTGRR